MSNITRKEKAFKEFICTSSVIASTGNILILIALRKESPIQHCTSAITNFVSLSRSHYVAIECVCFNYKKHVPASVNDNIFMKIVFWAITANKKVLYLVLPNIKRRLNGKMPCQFKGEVLTQSFQDVPSINASFEAAMTNCLLFTLHYS